MFSKSLPASPNPQESLCDSFDFRLDNPLKELEHQVKIDLNHLQSTISANSLETVPQNGTSILEKITKMDRTLKLFSLDKQSPLVVSGLNQVYQSVAKLIKLCDDLLLGDKNEVNMEYVSDTVKQLENSIQNLVTVTMSPNELRIHEQTCPKMNKFKAQSLPQISVQNASVVRLPRPPNILKLFSADLCFNFTEDDIKRNELLNDASTPESSDTISWHDSSEYLEEEPFHLDEFPCQSSDSEEESFPNSPSNDEAPPLPIKTKAIGQEFTDLPENFCEYDEDPDSPPPLPMKKKEITIFMKMFEEWQEYRKKSQCSSRPHSPYLLESSVRESAIEGTFPSPVLPRKHIQKNFASDDETSTSTSVPFEKFQTPADIPDLLDKEDVCDWLIFENRKGDCPTIGGGYVDALIVRATTVHENDLLFLETFLTTYRTFIKPVQLIQKLIDRYHRFDDQSDESSKRAVSQTLSLLIRIVGTFNTVKDLEKPTIKMLLELQFELLWKGDVQFANTLRTKFIEKYLTRLRHFENPENSLPRRFTLLHFKSMQIAEQMTLLDALLFSKIEASEILVWIQEQKKEKSPNLIRFIDHFNKLSIWAKSQILNQGQNVKYRNRYVLRFIEIINNLIQMNNFYSSYALVVALDSAAIRRLDLQESVIEKRKKCSAVFDPSSNFKVYREALAHATPPCIPYMGIILKDLTYAKDIKETIKLCTGMVNFSKKFRMYNIVKNLENFKQEYPFKRHKNIITFLNNFDESLGTDDELWQISQNIQPSVQKN